MPLIGIPLSTYKEELRKIKRGELPMQTIERFDERLAPFAEEISERAEGYINFDPRVQCHALPLEFYTTCTFEELAKIHSSALGQLPFEIEELFSKKPEYRIIAKIASSLWRYGFATVKEEWDTLVDAYRGIKNFSFGLPDFEVTLNYTVGCSAYSYTEYDPDVYLDAALCFIIHYKGEPVMTIGFSIARGRKLLISQVQLRKAKGNRFLYKLPKDRVGYVIDLMKQYFSGFRIYLVDGAKLVERYIVEFQNGIAQEQKSRHPDQKQIAHCEEKLALLKAETGEQIRRTYDLKSEKWRLSPHFPVHMHNRHYLRIVRS